MTEETEKPKPPMLTPTEGLRRERRAFGGFTLEEGLDWYQKAHEDLHPKD